MSGPKSNMQNPYVASVPEMDVQIKGLEKHIFYFGKGMQSKCLQSSKAFIDYVGRTYGESERQSILANDMIVTDMQEPKRIDTKEDFESMSYTDQELWKRQLELWVRTAATIDKNLSKAYSVLWSLCHSGLQQKIKSDVDYQAMTEGDVKELYRIINKICHGNNSTENPFVNLVEAWHNLLLIQGENYESLSEYLEAFEKKHEVVETCGGSPTSTKFRDLCMKELEARDQKHTSAYKTLREWQLEDKWKSSNKDETPPNTARTKAKRMLMEQYKVYAHIKRSGKRFSEYRIDLHNNYNNNNGFHPATVSDAHHKMDNCRTLPQRYSNSADSKTQKGDAYLQEDFPPVQTPANAPDREQATPPRTEPPEGWTFNKNVTCFKCGREGHVTRDCWFQTKADGSPLNTREAITKLHNKQSAERRMRHKANKTTTGSVNYMNAISVPTVEEFLNIPDECREPDQCDDSSYFQHNERDRCVEMDIREQVNHTYNLANQHLQPRMVLYDSCSTCDMFVNSEFLQDIRRCKWTLLLRTQNGECKVTRIGDLPGVGTVWYYPEGSANILSAYRMVINSGWSVKFDSDIDLVYRCTTLEGADVAFSPTKQGLYAPDCSKYFGAIEPGQPVCAFGTEITDNGTHFGMAMCDNARPLKRECHNNAQLSITDLIDTVENSKKRFAKRDQRRAQLVRRFQHVAGHPSDNTIIYSAATNATKNSPITRRDVKLALDVLGKSEYALRGKTTRTQPDAVTEQIVDVPISVREHYNDVELCADVMHVNKIPFLMSISKNIHYGTINALDNLKIASLEAALRIVLRTCRVRGFNVTTIHVDIQFKAIRDRKSLGVHVNAVSRGEHVPEAERFIRVIKERARCCYAMLPHSKLPRIMVIHLMITVVFCINAFVWIPGVSQFLPPITLIEGIALDFNKHFHVIHGECVHTHEGTTNDMTERTTGAIALGPSGNLQGGVRCFSLLTGKILHRLLNDITPPKMPQEAIRRTNCMANKRKSESGLIFADRTGTIDHDATITGVDEQHAPIDTQTRQVRFDIDHEDVPEDDDDIEFEEPTGVQDEIPNNEDTQNGTVDDSEENSNGSTQPEDREDVESIQPENREDEMQSPVDDDSDTESETEEPTRTRSGRISKPCDHSGNFPDPHRETHLAEEKRTQYDDKIESLEKMEYELYVSALQHFEYGSEEIEAIAHKAKTMSVKQGIVQHGKEAKDSAMKEVKNLVENECFGETDYSKLSQEMKDKALPILMFMVLKRNGLLKTRGVADGSVQRLHTNKEDVSSPTPDFCSFKCICAVIAREGRDVASADLPGFFLQTDQDGDQLILLKLTGEVALLLVECDSSRWKKHLQKENGKWVICVECKKAICGTMNAALLAYEKLASLFKSWDMIMNPYDPCVWNKDIQNEQFTVVFHIDDLLLSHKSPLVVTEMISKLDSEYGKKDKLTVTRGKTHEYLGMTVDFSVKNQCTFSQYDFIKKLSRDIPSTLDTSYRNTPAPVCLFKIDENSKLLDKERSEAYHIIVAKMLWISQRSRPDIQLATGFHCTRVKEPREHDWLKLGQLVGYVLKTRYFPLIISITRKGAVIYIDGAHAVHMNARGHSGLFVTQGRGAMINASKKLGVATTSSTETEIVSVGERLPKCTWFRYFRIAQGEEAVEDVLMQDNKSAIILQSNYPYSTRKGSKHIHVRYFFAVDKLKSRELKLMHCPTDKLIADYNSKPLQGKLFESLRNEIMGLDMDDVDIYKRRYVSVLKRYDLFDESESDLSSI